MLAAAAVLIAVPAAASALPQGQDDGTLSVRHGRGCVKLQFRGELFNTFNHPQFINPSANVALGSFGQIGATAVNPRLIQFALKYLF